MSENTSRTKPHRRVEKALDIMGISYMSEVGYFPPYTLDIYLPDFHLCIEVDGMGHFKKKDQVRDNWMLERYGVHTLRIKAKGPWQSQAKLEKEIMEFLEEHAETWRERKALWHSKN